MGQNPLMGVHRRRQAATPAPPRHRHCKSWRALLGRRTATLHCARPWLLQQLCRLQRQRITPRRRTRKRRVSNNRRVSNDAHLIICSRPWSKMTTIATTTNTQRKEVILRHGQADAVQCRLPLLHHHLHLHPPLVARSPTSTAANNPSIPPVSNPIPPVCRWTGRMLSGWRVDPQR